MSPAEAICDVFDDLAEDVVDQRQNDGQTDQEAEDGQTDLFGANIITRRTRRDELGGDEHDMPPMKVNVRNFPRLSPVLKKIKLAFNQIY